ncbi:MAG: hypothetical protein ABIP13_05935, partial [Tepidiformaceae bacterium]
MRTFFFPALLFSVLALIAVACGGDDAPKPPANAVSDETYLKAICSGSSRFSEALLTKTKPE